MSWELAGVSGATAAALFGAAFVVVTALYLLALRRRPVVVPFVDLWREALEGERTSQLFSRLTRWISWLLALLFCGLVVLALADPRGRGHAGSGRALVIAIDVSASMGATEGADTRIDVAREEARRIVRGLGASDRAIVIAMGDEARPLTPLTSDHASLLAAIDRCAPLDVVADLARTAHLAIDVTSGEASRELVVITDGAVEGEAAAQDALAHAGLRARQVSVGSDAANVAITALSLRRYPLDPSRNELLLEVTSASEETERVEVELRGDGEAVDVISLELAPGARVRRFFQDLTGVDRALEAELRRADGGRDALAADDRAYARVPERRRVRIAVVSEDDIYLEAALLLDEMLDVRQVAPSAFPPSEPYDVAILDRFVPSVPVGADAIWIHPAPEAGTTGPLRVTGEIDRPFFDRLRREDPLLRHAALGDVNVGRALLVDPEPSDVVVAADERGPLLVRGTREGHRFVALTFDVRESDLPLRPAFPLLLLDAIESFAPSDARYRGSILTGEVSRVSLPEGATRATLRTEGREITLPVEDGRATLRPTHAGLVTLETDAGDVLVAANLPAARELDLTRRALDLGPAPESGPVLETASARLPWEWLALAALALLFVEWATFHRRWTV